MKFPPYLFIENISTKSNISNFGMKVCLTAVEPQMFGYQCLHPIRTSFTVTCLCLDENDGIFTYKQCIMCIVELQYMHINAAHYGLWMVLSWYDLNLVGFARVTGVIKN